MEKKRSPWIAISLAVVIGIMVIVLLNGVIRPTTVVVAKVAIAPGTPLTADLLELRTVPSQAKPADALTHIEDIQNKVLAVGRAPGDYITKSVLGDTSQAGIPVSLQPDHLAIAVKVDLGSGIAGLLREGQKVPLIGMLSPDVLHSIAAPATLMNSQFQIEPTALPSGLPAPTPSPTPTPTPPEAPLARIAISGLKVLMVPQSFRYEELPSNLSQDPLFTSISCPSPKTSSQKVNRLDSFFTALSDFLFMPATCLSKFFLIKFTALFPSRVSAELASDSRILIIASNARWPDFSASIEMVLHVLP